MPSREEVIRARDKILQAVWEGKFYSEDFSKELAIIEAYREENGLRQDIANFKRILREHPIEALHDIGLLEEKNPRHRLIMIIHLVFHHFCEYEECEKHITDRIKNSPIEELIKAARDAMPSVLLELINQPTITAIRTYFSKNYKRIMQRVRESRIMLLANIRAMEIEREDRRRTIEREREHRKHSERPRRRPR